MQQKIIQKCIVVLLLLNGLDALYGGGLLMIDPSGNRLQLPLEWLEHTTFNNFLLPGIVLFVVDGLFSLIVLGVMAYNKCIYPALVFTQGCLLVGWIIVQRMMAQHYHLLQTIMATVGLALIVCAFLLHQVKIKNSVVCLVD